VDLGISPCIPCVTGFHWECPSLQGDNCCCDSSGPLGITQNKRGGPVKFDEDVTDPQSTGRKRAAVAYPLEEGMTCEWSSLKYAGGGSFPIIGCPGHKATNRHHGPDKNVLNNSEGNVHRICAFCHNRWHARNDPLYQEVFGTDQWKTHDPETRATQAEVLESELFWQTTPAQRIKVLDHEH